MEFCEAEGEKRNLPSLSICWVLGSMLDIFILSGYLPRLLAPQPLLNILLPRVLHLMSRNSKTLPNFSTARVQYVV